MSNIDARLRVTLDPGDDDRSPRLLRVGDDATGRVLSEVYLSPSQVADLVDGTPVTGRGVVGVTLPQPLHRTDITVHFDPLGTNRDAVRDWAVRTVERDLPGASCALSLVELGLSVTFSLYGYEPPVPDDTTSTEALLALRAQAAGFALDPRWDRTRPWYTPPPTVAEPVSV